MINVSFPIFKKWSNTRNQPIKTGFCFLPRPVVLTRGLGGIIGFLFDFRIVELKPINEKFIIQTQFLWAEAAELLSLQQH